MYIFKVYFLDNRPTFPEKMMLNTFMRETGDSTDRCLMPNDYHYGDVLLLWYGHESIDRKLSI